MILVAISLLQVMFCLFIIVVTIQIRNEEFLIRLVRIGEFRNVVRTYFDHLIISLGLFAFAILVNVFYSDFVLYLWIGLDVAWLIVFYLYAVRLFYTMVMLAIESHEKEGK